MKTLTSSGFTKFSILCLLVAGFASGFVYAESAPVYDVEEMVQPGDSANVSQQAIVPKQLAQANVPNTTQEMVQSGTPQNVPQPESENAQMDASQMQSAAQEGNSFVPMEEQSVAAKEQGLSMTADAANAPLMTADASNAPIRTAEALPGKSLIQTADNSGIPMDERINRIEQQMDNLQSGETAARMESLQTQVQSLRGQVEQLSHQLQQLVDQQKNQAGPQPTKAAPGTEAVAGAEAVDKANQKPGFVKTPIVDENNLSAVQPDLAEEQQIYQNAYNLIKNKKYAEAANTLQIMLQKYPSGQFASNAHYWLGELYGVMGKNDLALNEFTNVVRDYPESPRVSDAQLKLGLIYAAEFKWFDAKMAFRRVIRRYPGTPSARLASEQLRQIRQAGH